MLNTCQNKDLMTHSSKITKIIRPNQGIKLWTSNGLVLNQTDHQTLISLDGYLDSAYLPLPPIKLIVSAFFNSKVQTILGKV